MSQEIKDYLSKKIYETKNKAMAIALCGGMGLALMGCGQTEIQPDTYMLTTDKGSISIEVTDVKTNPFTKEKTFKGDVYTVKQDETGYHVYDSKTDKLLYSAINGSMELTGSLFEVDTTHVNYNEQATETLDYSTESLQKETTTEVIQETEQISKTKEEEKDLISSILEIEDPQERFMSCYYEFNSANWTEKKDLSTIMMEIYENYPEYQDDFKTTITTHLFEKGENLAFFPEFNDDEKVVRYAICQGCNLNHISERLQQDIEIIELALDVNPQNAWEIPTNLLFDKEFCLEMINKGYLEIYEGLGYQGIECRYPEAEKLYHNKDIIQAVDDMLEKMGIEKISKNDENFTSENSMYWLIPKDAELGKWGEVLESYSHSDIKEARQELQNDLEIK